MEHKEELAFEFDEELYVLEVEDAGLDIELGDAIIVQPDQTLRYEGEYTVVPTPARQELATQFRYMEDNVTVLAIPYHEVSNADGTTVIIGGVTNNGL